ncbi:MAG: Fe-S protein assembly co-chaperone HscB [Halioglobus sp.]
MSLPNLQQNYFQLFDLPVGFSVDQAKLGDRYRVLQGELHPDRYAGAPAQEQCLAVQYSALVNEAYAALRKPLTRALYLMQLAGWSGEEISRQQIDGGFLMMQMELREKLESIPSLVDPDEVLEHLVDEITDDLGALRKEFESNYANEALKKAAQACVKMQYLDKLLVEAEQLESDLMDK